MLFFWRSAVLRSGDGDHYHGYIRHVLGHRVSLYVRIVVMVRIRDPIQVVEGGSRHQPCRRAMLRGPQPRPPSTQSIHTIMHSCIHYLLHVRRRSLMTCSTLRKEISCPHISIYDPAVNILALGFAIVGFLHLADNSRRNGLDDDPLASYSGAPVLTIGVRITQSFTSG